MVFVWCCGFGGINIHALPKVQEGGETEGDGEEDRRLLARLVEPDTAVD